MPLHSLPDTALYRIAAFAAPPTHRSAVIVRLGIPTIPDSLWQILLSEEYGVKDASTNASRSCKRLKRDMLQRVQDAHRSMLQKTEFAFFYVAELTSQQKNKELLTKSKLLSILQEFGPNLRLSGPLRSGGVFLVELCRAKKVRETTIVKCVEHMLTKCKCDPNDITNESPSSRQTALSVAAARGLASVVALLLEAGAQTEMKCSGRFRLAFAKSSISGKKWTALEFAYNMREAEIRNGTNPRKLKGLDRCIKLLKG